MMHRVLPLPLKAASTSSPILSISQHNFGIGYRHELIENCANIPVLLVAPSSLGKMNDTCVQECFFQRVISKTSEQILSYFLCKCLIFQSSVISQKIRQITDSNAEPLAKVSVFTRNFFKHYTVQCLNYQMRDCTLLILKLLILYLLALF